MIDDRVFAAGLGVERLDQAQQTSPGHDLIHFNQETFTAGLLTFACVLGISERHLLHRGSTAQFMGQPYLTRLGSLFQRFLSDSQSKHFNNDAVLGNLEEYIILKFMHVKLRVRLRSV